MGDRISEWVTDQFHLDSVEISVLEVRLDQAQSSWILIIIVHPLPHEVMFCSYVFEAIMRLKINEILTAVTEIIKEFFS